MISGRFALAAALICLGAPAAAQKPDDQFRAGVSAFTRDGDRVAARAAFLRVIELDPTHAAARFNLAMLAEEEERWDEALLYYGEYVKRARPDDLYARVAERKIGTLTKFRELDQTPEGKAERIYLQFVQRAQSKLGAGDVGGGLALAELATLRSPNRFEGFLVYGVALLEAERPKEARTALARAKSLAGKDVAGEVDALLRRAERLSGSEDHIKVADEALAAGKYSAAAERYGQAWTLTDAPEYGFQAARAWSLAGNTDKAAKVYEVLGRSSDTATAAAARSESARLSSVAMPAAGGAAPAERPEFARAKQLNSTGKYYEADAELTQLLDPTLPDRGYAAIFEARAAARMGLREYAGAVQDLSYALLLDPTRSAAYEQRAVAYAALRQYEDAARDIARAIERVPSEAVRLRKIRADYVARIPHP